MEAFPNRTRTWTRSSGRVSGQCGVAVTPARDPLLAGVEIALVVDVSTTHQCVVAEDGLGGGTPVPC